MYKRNPFSSKWTPIFPTTTTMSSQSSSHTSSPTPFEQAFPNYQAFLSDNRHITSALACSLPPPTDLQLTHNQPINQIIPRLSPPPSPTHPDTPDPIGAFIAEITNSNEELDTAHKLHLQAANILHSSVDLHINESPQRISSVRRQRMQMLTSTDDEVPTDVNEQWYRLWVYCMALVGSTSTLHHIQICTAMQVLDFAPFPLPDPQFVTPFCWAIEHAVYIIQGRLMFQFTLA
jgi:hypothetical protein